MCLSLFLCFKSHYVIFMRWVHNVDSWFVKLWISMAVLSYGPMSTSHMIKESCVYFGVRSSGIIHVGEPFNYHLGFVFCLFPVWICMFVDYIQYRLCFNVCIHFLSGLYNMMFWFCLLQVWTLWFVEHMFFFSMLSQVCGVFMHCPGSVQGVKPPYVFCFYRSLFPLRTRCCSHVVNCSLSLSFFGLFRSFALQSSFSFHQRVFAFTCSRRQACALQMLPCVGSSFALPYPTGFCIWGLTRSFDSSALLGLPFSKARPYLFDFATNFNTDRSFLFGRLFRSTRDLFGFDHTCGYPGEGPPWSCVSANVNSVNSHPHCLEWVDDLICIQEARLSSTNIQNPRKKLNSIGRDFFYAKLLRPTRQKNGIKHVPHGGTACIAAKDLCRNFTSQDDATSLWQELADTSRISAVWVQILPKLRLLAFTFYGQATMNGISSHDINNLYLEKIFTIASQFGDVP